ncbi:MAG: acetyl-CoA acetyltransferase [Acidimicrobiales bacterium]|nr:acetyl-CoA acetyltransferase [Acidimicrobiales bacterium]
MDPRTPVLVGGGQITHHADEPSPEPAELMALALRAAEADSGGRDLLRSIDSMRTVGQLSWRYAHVGRLVAAAVGAAPRQHLQSRMGGNLAGSMVIDAARAIQAGEIDVAVVCGAEAWRTRSRARAAGTPPEWTAQVGTEGAPEPYGPEDPLSSPLERERGIAEAPPIYALFEVALRAGLGLDVLAHRHRIGELWSAFSRVAAGNPWAWDRTAPAAADLWEPGPGNRMIAFPYTKRLCSNNHVDQGAAVILTSVAAAEHHGVPRDRWVFLHAGAEAVDHWFVSNRVDLCSSPAIRVAGRDLFALAGTEPDALDHVDLYSCFPSAVQIAARELGLLTEADGSGWGGIGARLPLTVTGGMNFAGGPWNDYPTHGLATMADVLRRDPGSTGLCTANGGWTTEHALLVLGTEPPAAGAFRSSTPQAEVDALPAVALDDDWTGPAVVESVTVVHDREGPHQARAAVRTPRGDRAWCTSTDPGLMAAAETTELVGASAVRTGDAGFIIESPA